MFADYGCQVTLIGRSQHLHSKTASASVSLKALQARGITVLTGAPVSRVGSAQSSGSRGPDNITVRQSRCWSPSDGYPTPRTLASSPWESCAYIPVDEDYRTSAPGVFAIGDCVLALAHVAAAEDGTSQT